MFSLVCSNGTTNSTPATASVTVNTSGSNAALSGKVDSSFVDLNSANNRVYVFAGSVVPVDLRGIAGDAVATAPVLQDENACTFSYSIPTLAAGTYTLAFTSQADNPTLPDVLTFLGTVTVTVTAAPAIRNLTPGTIRTVGPGKTYASIPVAYAAANAGDVIEVDTGLYQNNVISLGKNNITIRGVGGLAHVQGTQDIGNGKGLFVVSGTRTRIENMEFSGATVADENGAGIRAEGRDLSICGSYFHDNENGILGDDAGTLTIDYSTFANNGFGDGKTHNVYVAPSTLVFRHNYSHHAKIGHALKSRGKVNYILYNRLMTEADGTGSYEIDLPNGGLSFIVGNLIQQGANNDNSTLIAYDQEHTVNPVNDGRLYNLYLINNTIVNDDAGGAFVVAPQATTNIFVSRNNLFVGPGTLYSGKSPTTNLSNLQSSSPGFVNRTTFDYNLTSGSPARDQGTSPGIGDGFSLAPVYEYAHPARRQARESDATIDIGAYEFP